MRLQIAQSSALIALLAGALPGVAGAQSRDLGSYVFLALHELRTKGITVTGTGNIGVNEPQGFLSASSHGEIDAPGSQVVADFLRVSADSRCSANGLFSNHVFRPMGGCGPGSPVSLPIVMNPTAACGFPVSFPACNSGNRVTVVDGATQQLAPDPANFGDVEVLSGGQLVLTGGNYVFCSLNAGRNAEILVRGPSTVDIVGDVNLSNAVFLGGDPSAQPAVAAQNIKLLVKGPSVHFSGSAEVHASLCAPNAWLRITHGANVEGTFVARTVRTERITATGNATPTTTTSTTAHPTTTTTHAGSTTTTTMPGCTASGPGAHCGNGHVDCGEQCDGHDFGNVTCPGSTVPGDGLRCRPDCTIDDSGCPCGNGVKDAGEECDPLASPTGCPEGKTCGPVDNRATACRCVVAEICGNCIDDDGNGLTDFEDPACCPQGQTFTMSITRGRMRVRGSKTKLVLRSLLAEHGMENVNPLAQDVFLQIRRPGDGEILCAEAPAKKFMRMHKAFKFWDRKHLVASARGVQDIKVRVRKKKGGVRFRAFGRQVEMQTPAHGSLQVTVGFHDLNGGPNMCSSQLQDFRAGRTKALLAP